MAMGSSVTLNSVRREIVSTLTIVSYDKVRGRNKEQRWLRPVCVRFFITNITQSDTISLDTIMSYTSTMVLIEHDALNSVPNGRLINIVDRS